MDNIEINFLKYYYKQYKYENNKEKLLNIFYKYFNKFDYIFYKNFYKDLNKLKINQINNHWRINGKKEGRIINEFQLKFNLFKSYFIINKYKNLKFNKDEKKINILIRTSNREKYFKKCLNSILNQNYSNYNIIISYDNLKCEKYLVNNQENIKYIYINKNNYNQKEKCFYNDYLNILNNHVKDGFIFYLDDDDMFTHSNCLKIINENINNNNDLLVFKFLRPDKIIYLDNINNLKIGNIGTSCFCYHSKFSKELYWDKKQYGDYYFFEKLIKKNLNIINIDYIIAKTISNDRIGNFGL